MTVVVNLKLINQTMTDDEGSTCSPGSFASEGTKRFETDENFSVKQGLSTKLFSCWAFTTERSNVIVEDERNKGAIAWTGPKEETQLKATDGLAHGLLYVKSQTTKPNAAKILLRMGFALHDSYLQPTRNKEGYMKYMYKTVGGNEAKTKEDYINIGVNPRMINVCLRNSESGSIQQRLLIKAMETFPQKPSCNNLLKFARKEFEFKLTENNVREVYKSWSCTNDIMESDHAEKFGKLAAKRRKIVMTRVEAERTLRKIMKNASSCRYKGRVISNDQALIVLCLSVVELALLKQLEGGIETAPHVLLTGEASAGKTLLGNILYPMEVAGVFTNDSGGVGQIALSPNQNVVKFDDSCTATFRDDKIVSAIKTMYHNKWSLKIHGAQITAAGTMAFISSNDPRVLDVLGLVGDKAATERRFMHIEFEEKMDVGLDGMREINFGVTCDACMNILLSFDELIERNLDSNIVKLFYDVKEL